MVASSAFRELSAVLAQLESSGTEVQHAAVDEDLTDADETVTAELSLGVPVLPDGEASDGVSITTADATVEDGQVALEVTVTVPGDGAAMPDGLTVGGGTNSQAGSEAQNVPAYKDPDALQAAYEQYDTFPAMTDALDVDVTSETVRRHMVKYDIHDPDAATPAHALSRESEHKSSESERQRIDDSETAESDSGAQSNSASQSDRVTQSAVTDGGNAAVADATRAQAASDATSVVSLLADRPTESPGDFGLPDSLTVDGLTAAVNQSRTVHELASEIGVNQAAAREFLRSFDLINFVAHPLATDQVTVSSDEVRRRLGPAGR
jgi:hypothetical protein